MSSLTKLFSALFLFSLFFALSTEAYADDVVVTGGYAFMEGTIVNRSNFHFSGPGFDIQGYAQDAFILSGCTCMAGTVGSFNGTLGPTYGSATVNGITYGDIGLAGSVSFSVNNTRPVPRVFNDFTMTVPFTLSGTITGYTDPAKNQPVFRLNVTGHGLMVAQYGFGFANPNFSGVPIFDIWSITYNLDSAMTPPLAEIRGRVVNDDGTPASGLGVEISGFDSRIAITDANGNYAFKGLPVNRFYRIRSFRFPFFYYPISTFLENDETINFDRGIPLDTTRNPLDVPEFFIRQQYLDFLSREPDQGGINYWLPQMKVCHTDESCNQRRADISAAFFIEQEFQQTGFFITRIYKAALGRQPSYAEFTSDRSRVVGNSDLAGSQQAFADEFVERADFQTLYPETLTNQEFVNKLFDTANLRPYTREREYYIFVLNNGGTRSEVLRRMVEDVGFTQREYNPSFVLMEYFGYLRRDPDPAGYDFWLSALNSQPNNYRGMVCSFITSAEYQKRFSPLVTHTNAECGP